MWVPYKVKVWYTCEVHGTITSYQFGIHPQSDDEKRGDKRTISIYKRSMYVPKA